MGRYETVVTTKHGTEVNVLRSLRHAPQEEKIQPTASEMDVLCGLFEAKMTVSPKNKSRSNFTTKAKVGAAEASAKTNVVSSPVNKRRISSRLSASAAMKAILTEDNEWMTELGSEESVCVCLYVSVPKVEEPRVE